VLPNHTRAIFSDSTRLHGAALGELPLTIVESQYAGNQADLTNSTYLDLSEASLSLKN
jgi:hypothetical protein